MSPKNPGTRKVRRFSGGKEKFPANPMEVPLPRMDSEAACRPSKSCTALSATPASGMTARPAAVRSRRGSRQSLVTQYSAAGHPGVEDVLRMPGEDLHRQRAAPEQQPRGPAVANHPSTASKISGPQTIVQRFGRWPAKMCGKYVPLNMNSVPASTAAARDACHGGGPRNT